MAKSENQKLKLYTTLQILKEETDETHAITMPQLISALERRGINAERKSVGDDIKLINDYTDFEIEYERNHGYRLTGRTFQSEELLMLADIIGSARFITKKKSDELIGKLSKEASRYERTALKNQCAGAHIKMANESIYYNLNTVQAAMDENLQITFSYYKYNRNKEFVEAHPGKVYTVSPWDFIWNDKNYYLVAVDDLGKIVHFRLDRIKNAALTTKARLGRETFARADKGEYEAKSFGMFGGQDCLVTLHCKEEAAGVIVDRFGTTPTFRQSGKNEFDVSVRVFLSPQFYAWLCGLSGIVTLTYPQSAIDGYREHLASALDALAKKV
ncbi:MAG: WYL domain-containing protein [Clostridia bacterium]|nr:WYL domain-containing protein [Clostridia bacterium]